MMALFPRMLRADGPEVLSSLFPAGVQEKASR